MRLANKYPYITALKDIGVTYPSPSNLSYVWSFGIFALVCLGIQIVTGLFLAMHYSPDVNLAFGSVEHIMRDVNYGWLIRYTHANGASLFFAVVYIHLFRGLYYSSFAQPRQFLWISGVIILFLMIATAFLGYVLPWGQMSFWAATVITNLVSAIPVVGGSIVVWLWGGYAINNATLTRFYTLHFLMPFVLLAVVVIHILLLHEFGSNNPIGVDFYPDTAPFTPYYASKDLYAVVLFFIVFGIFLYFAPNLLGHPDNYIPANPLVTPNHIVPEWYFLPFYAILRSVPSKLGGVIAFVGAIVLLAFVPVLLEGEIRSLKYRLFSTPLFFLFVLICLTLGWIGSQPVQAPYYQIGQIATVGYYAYFLVVFPIVIRFEIFLVKLFQSQ